MIPGCEGHGSYIGTFIEATIRPLYVAFSRQQRAPGLLERQPKRHRGRSFESKLDIPAHLKAGTSNRAWIA